MTYHPASLVFPAPLPPDQVLPLNPIDTTPSRLNDALRGAWMMAELFQLSDSQWAAIAPLLPCFGGKPRVEDRRVISGILRRYREGLRWRALPAEYDPRTAVLNRFRRREQARPVATFICALTACDDPPNVVMIGGAGASSAAGAKGGQDEAIGRSRSGRTTKIHAVVNGQGRPSAADLWANRRHPGRAGAARGQFPQTEP